MTQPEPWLRGTLTGIPAVQRAVLHALELAHEDLARWCADLSDEEFNSQPDGLTSIAFHLHHTARSMDQLLTYAEGHELNARQLALLKSEEDIGATRSDLSIELAKSFKQSERRIRDSVHWNLEAARTVGSRKLPTTVGGVLVHVAEHTQRHVGQTITTAKRLLSRRLSDPGTSFQSG